MVLDVSNKFKSVIYNMFTIHTKYTSQGRVFNELLIHLKLSNEILFKHTHTHSYI